MQLLAKYPDDRPETADDVAKVLESQGGAAIVTGTTEAPAPRSGVPTMVWVGAIGLIAVLALIGGVAIGVIVAGM
jgi:hypothetical protein